MIRQVLLAAATLAALSPAISNASSERVSLKACAKAFAEKIAAPSAAYTFKLDYRADTTGSFIEFYASDRQFKLEAHNPKTGETIARANCSTDGHGAVTEVAMIPLDSKATLASTF